MNTLLTARGLTLGIAGRTLLDGLDLDIATGQRWAVLGPNGAGKTTLLQALAGLRLPVSGTLQWKNRLLADIPRRHLARDLGLLLQDDSDPFPATVLETALTGRHPHMGRWDWETAQDIQLAQQALSDADLATLAERQVASLSGGERRRLAIATLLTQAPQLALLDEPTNHLDLRHQAQLMQLMAQRFGDTEHASLTVLHDPNLALRHCSHLLLVYGDGRWETGTVAQLAQAERLSALYGQPLKVLSQENGQPLFLPA